MSSSGASAGQESHFQRSFSALVACLRKRFRGQGTVSLPNDVIAPFRKPFHPNESSSLRDLAKLLENGRPHKDITRLEKQSFYYVATIVLHFPYSVVQNKLLYLFMETVRQYKNLDTWSSVLSRVHGIDLTPAEVKEQGDFIGRKLSSVVLRHLVSRDKVTQLRWKLAQFLSVLVQFSTAARAQVTEMTECQHLAVILETDHDHVLRILVADAIRAMLYNGAERAIFGTSPAIRKIIKNLPRSKTGDSRWLGEYLNRVDVAGAVAMGYLKSAPFQALLLTYPRSDPVFLVQRLDCDDHMFYEALSPFVASVSDEITFLMPKGVEVGTLTLFSVPVSKQVSVNVGSQPTILEIRYQGDEGDRFVNGTKSAIGSLMVTFCDEESAEAFAKAIEERRNKTTPDGAPKAPGTPRKQSFAMIDISSTSGGDGGGVTQTSNTLHTSEIDASSPLRNISLRDRQRRGSASASSLQKQIASTMSRSNVRAGEDTPVLSKPPDSRQFIDRLRASQEGAAENDSKRPSSARKAQSLLKVDLGESSTLTKQSPHLPADANQVSAPASSGRKSTGKRPADPVSSSLSNQAKKRSKAAATTGQASIDGDAHSASRQHVKLKETMAQITGAAKDGSQGSTASAKPGLKRRPDKEPTTSKTEQSQKASKTTSNAVEYDIPDSDDEDIRPAKKTKTKTSKPAPKTTTKDHTEKKKSAVQVTASPKGRKMKETDKEKVKKTTDNKKETTAASSRARRAPKTPKYIESSDESEDGAAGEEPGEEKDMLDDQEDDKDEETAEDSYPVDNGTYEAATQFSRAAFESQLLPDMADRESSDDGAVPREQSPQRGTASNSGGSTALPLLRKPSEKRKQAATKNGHPVPETTTKQAVHKDEPKVQKSTAAEGATSRRNPSVNNSTDSRAIPEKDSASVAVTDKQTPAKGKARKQGSAVTKATPQRNTKRLSETSIPPASEKLLRKTPIVHFGPQGPANQAVQGKLAGKQVQFNDVGQESQDRSPLKDHGDDEHSEQTDESFQHHEPSPDNAKSTSQAGGAREDDQSRPGQESYEFPAPAEPVDDNDMGYLDEPDHLESEAVVKSPEVDETQPRSPHRDDAAGAEFAEEERESEEAVIRIEEAQVESERAHDEVSAIQGIDSDGPSSVDRSYDQEASEYVASEVEEEASTHSLPQPENQPPRKPDTRPYRPQTPLLDDDAPGRGYQRAKEPPRPRAAARQSIGVTTILDEGYPAAPKAINTQKLRQAPQETAANQSSRARASLAALPVITQRLKKSETGQAASSVDNRKEVRKASIEPVALSVSSRRATSGSNSHGSDVKTQSRQERTQEASLHHAISNMESVVVDEEAMPAPKPRPQSMTRAPSTTASANMPSTSLPARAARPMAPPPLPRTLPSRATRKPEPPRKSWPESRAEKAARISDAAAKDPIKSSKSEPVRIKKRMTLPLAADEPLPEADLPPATPVSLSTRLDLHTNLPTHAAPNAEDSRMEDACQKLGNGSITLVNEEEESVRGDRSAMWGRAGRRQRSESSDDDVSMAASPSRRKGHTEGRDSSTVERLTARDSQRGLVAAIISIANDVLFRFGDEEDAITAKVDEYDRGGKGVLDTLMDTWTQRLEHEHKILQDGLRAEKDLLSTAAGLVDEEHTAGAWIGVVSDDKLVGKVQRKGTRLTKQIEALMQ
ncbi:hypothetical protein H2200_009267 [Cladophialophora chaetospira]|uniref:Uncharacterized protein n=1 Tax=Cladophialophora chaetospira TaxID=386627 RepID=A0AA38X3T8_9EURO|nr:hypothetical protein H2200_009267 [Cladophialophora chaetospira]